MKATKMTKQEVDKVRNPSKFKSKRPKTPDYTRIYYKAEYIMEWVETIDRLPDPTDRNYRVFGWGPSKLYPIDEAVKLDDNRYLCRKTTYKEEAGSLYRRFRLYYPEVAKTVKVRKNIVVKPKAIQHGMVE